MKTRLLRFLGIEADEVERVLLLFIMGFSMGMFMATISVASQSLFLEYFSEENELRLFRPGSDVGLQFPSKPHSFSAAGGSQSADRCRHYDLY